MNYRMCFVGDAEGTTSSKGVAAAMKTAEEFWRRQLVPNEDVQRLDELYPVRRSPGEPVPPDEVSQVCCRLALLFRLLLLVIVPVSLSEHLPAPQGFVENIFLLLPW